MFLLLHVHVSVLFLFVSYVHGVIVQGELGEPGQKGSKGDKGEHVSIYSSFDLLDFDKYANH